MSWGKKTKNLHYVQTNSFKSFTSLYTLVYSDGPKDEWIPYHSVRRQNIKQTKFLLTLMNSHVDIGEYYKSCIREENYKKEKFFFNNENVYR